MADPVWLQHARAALKAAISADPSAGIKVRQLIEDESVGSEGIAQAILFWVDCLIEASPEGTHTGPYPVPDIWPADMSQRERWSLRLIGAQLNEDRTAADRLLREATMDRDHTFEYALTAVIMAGAGLGGRLMPTQDDA
ncbi:hypothetical protein [Nocardia abscessus]|uniref:hypothetical protein n=1 Tax=Nocardia abscessus TaxID=120957 RepID=UPI00245724A7|nr:hypothetical protein [Nocardia abscessus]